MSNFYLLQYFNVFLNNNCNKRLSSVKSGLLHMYMAQLLTAEMDTDPN